MKESVLEPSVIAQVAVQQFAKEFTAKNWYVDPSVRSNAVYSRWKYLALRDLDKNEYELKIEASDMYLSKPPIWKKPCPKIGVKIEISLTSKYMRKLKATTTIVLDFIKDTRLPAEILAEVLAEKTEKLTTSVKNRFDKYQKNMRDSQTEAIKSATRQREWRNLLKELKIDTKLFQFLDGKSSLIQLRIREDDDILAQILSAISGIDKDTILKKKLATSL